MFKTLKTLLLSALMLIMCPLVGFAKDYVDINNLVENSKQFDNKEVLVKGEAVGESMVRGDYAWVNINDGTNDIGIWLKKEELDKINMYGDYKHKGDTLQIYGVFHRDCTEHGGDVDIHAKEVKVIERGNKKDIPLNVKRLRVSMGLIGVTIILAGVYFKKYKN